MLQLTVRTNLKAFQERVSEAARKQIPFATALALTELARDVALAERKNEAAKLDRPRPFTQDAIKVLPARKGKFVAKVVMQDLAAKYLEPYEFGGRNVLNSKVLLKPVGSVKDLDQYGNLPRRLLAQLRARSDVFVGEVKTKRGVVSGVWQKTTDEGGKVWVRRERKGGGIRKKRSAEGTNTSGQLKLLIKFAEAHPVDDKNRLNWFDLAGATVTKNFNRRFGAALAKAIATAR